MPGSLSSLAHPPLAWQQEAMCAVRMTDRASAMPVHAHCIALSRASVGTYGRDLLAMLQGACVLSGMIAGRHACRWDSHAVASAVESQSKPLPIHLLNLEGRIDTHHRMHCAAPWQGP